MLGLQIEDGARTADVGHGVFGRRLSERWGRCRKARTWAQRLKRRDLRLPIIITPMASDAPVSWTNRTVLRPGREEPFLCIQDVVVFVRDLDVSKRFYVNQLGFELITERCLPCRHGKWEAIISIFWTWDRGG